MMKKLIATVGIISAGLFGLTNLAQAEPAYARMYKAEYGYTPSCNACHTSGGGSQLNLYGKAFLDKLHNRTSFAKIAMLDSDKDGFNNETEIAAKSNPGDSSSLPKQPGDWLNKNALIPLQVRNAFPEAKKYKPIDTILTAKEIAKAAAWNVAFTKADENTIYVPVINGKAAGTAIIISGTLPTNNESESAQNKTILNESAQNKNQKKFYLLVTTDRSLNIQSVTPLNLNATANTDSPNADNNSSLLALVRDSKIYASLKGLNAQSINTLKQQSQLKTQPQPLPQSNETTTATAVDLAIMNAAQRGIALIHVRLKK